MNDYEPTSDGMKATDGYAAHRERNATKQKERSIHAREIGRITEKVRARTEERPKLTTNDVLLAVAGIALVLVYPVGALVFLYFAVRVVSCAWH